MEEEKELQLQQQQAQEAGQQPALEEDVIGNEEEGNAQDGARTVSVPPSVAANPAPAASEAYAAAGIPAANEGSASVTNTGKTSLSTEQGSEQTTQDKVLTPAGEEAMRQAGERVDDRQAAYQAAVASNEVPSTKSYYEPAHARLLVEEEQAQRERMDAQARRDASRQARREWRSLPREERAALDREETVGDAAERIYREKLASMQEGGMPVELDEKTKRRLHRQASREAEMARETRIAEVAERLGYHYVPEPVYRRQQLLKAIISGLGDLGALAARSVTARNSGIILPFDTLTAGTVRAREMGDKEREAVRAGIRQLAGEQEAAALENLEQAEKDRLAVSQNPNYWQTVTSKRTEKNKGEVSNEASSTVTKGHKAFDPESGTGMVSWGKLQNGEYLMPGRNGEYKVTDNGATAAFNYLFDEFSKMVPRDEEGNPTNEDKGSIGELWTTIRGILTQINGAPDENTRQKYQRQLSQYAYRLMKLMEGVTGGDAIIAEYEAILGNQKLFDGYRAYGNASSQGGGMVPSSEEEAMGGDMDW